METVERIEELEERLTRLEEAVFSERRHEKNGSSAARESRARRAGPSAGVRSLIAQHFFESPRSLGDVRKALDELAYRYSAQAVDIALRRLSRRDAPLVLLRQKGRNFYADRK